MGLLSQTISHLFNGVSQQAPVLRSPSQGAEQINGLSSPVKGLKKRPSLNFIRKLDTQNFGTKSLFHIVDRDTSTRYQVVVHPGGGLKVYDLQTGLEKTVNVAEGGDYLVSANPAQDLRMMTVEDYTFVLNREVVPVMRPWRYTNGQAFKATVTLTPSLDWVFGVALSHRMSFGYGGYKTSRLPIFYDLQGNVTEYVVRYFRSAADAKDYIKNVYAPSFFREGDVWRWKAEVQGDSSTGVYQEVTSATLRGSGGQGTFEQPLNSLTPMRGAMDYGVADVNSEYAFSQNLWAFLEQIGQVPDLSYQRLCVPITWSKRVFASAPNPNYYLAHDARFVAEVFTGSWGAFNVDVMSWYCRPLDGTTMLTGGWDSTNLRYEGYPNAGGLTKLASAPNGLVVNGEIFMEPIAASMDEVLSSYQAAITTRFPALQVFIVEGKLVLKTTGAGQELSVREYRKGYAKVVYDYTGDYKEKLFLYVKAGVPEQSYRVSINGNKATYSTPNSENAAGYAPERVASELAGQIAGWTGFQVTQFGRFVEITPPANGATFDFYDSWSSQALMVMKNQVESEQALPPRFVEGVPIKVGRGDAGYYVHYVAGGQSTQGKTGGSLSQQVESWNNVMSSIRFGSQLVSSAGGWNALEAKEAGGWEETSWPYEDREFDPSTMPHVLVSEADGSFTFKPLVWGKRAVGDNKSAPTPSFVGKSIKDLFFYRNRLGFMTNESVSFSKNGSFFDFWPDTARQLLDSDPIDAQLSHTKVSILHSAVVFNNSVVLFSEKTQFVVTGGETFTPRTVNIRPANEYDSNPLIRPVNAGDTVFFVNERSGYSQLMEYQSLGQQGNVATDVTGHVPTYVPRDVTGLAASSTETCAVMPKGKSLWVYKYLWGGDNRKVQDSWSRWEFDSNVLNAAWVKSKLYLTLEQDGGLALEVMDFQVEAPDVFGWEAHLDHKLTVKQEDLDVSIGGATTQVAIVLPYQPREGLVVVGEDGQVIEHTLQGNRVLVPSGSATFTVGYPFPFKYRFSPIYVRGQDGGATVDGTLTLRTLAVSYAETTRMVAKVTAKGRTPHQSTLSKTTPQDGVHRFAVGSDALTVGIEILDDTHQPLHLLSAAWEGQFQRRSRAG